MGFLDDLKKGADNIAGSINKSVSGAQTPTGQPGGGPPVTPSDSYFHDLGVLTYQQQTGRATEQTAAEIERVMAGLQQNEQTGQPTSFALRSTAPVPPGPGQPPPPTGAPVTAPPPPGGGVQPPPAPGAPVTAPPPPGGGVQPPPAPSAPVAPPPPPGAVAPPPPPGTVGTAGDGNVAG